MKFWMKNFHTKWHCGVICTYSHCQIIDENNNNCMTECVVIIARDTLYIGEVLSGNFDDLSGLKYLKKLL